MWDSQEGRKDGIHFKTLSLPIFRSSCAKRTSEGMAERNGDSPGTKECDHG